MKILILIALILGCFSAALSQATPVKLFVKADGVGDSQPIPVGTFRVDSKNIPAPPGAKIQFSVSVVKGFRVEFCSTAAPPTSPVCESFGEGVHNLTLTDFATIKVGGESSPPATGNQALPPTETPTAQTVNQGPPAAPAMLAYERLNYLGRSQEFSAGMFRFSRGEFGKLNDNQVMSVIINPGYKAIFCIDEGVYYRGAGDCEEHEAGKINIRLANYISFINVIDLKDKGPSDESQPVVLYEDQGQGGKMQGFAVGEYRSEAFSKLRGVKISSVNVKKGYSVEVCSGAGNGASTESACETLASGKHDRKTRDTPFSIRVFSSTK